MKVGHRKDKRKADREGEGGKRGRKKAKEGVTNEERGGFKREWKGEKEIIFTIHTCQEKQHIKQHTMKFLVLKANLFFR